MLKHPYPRIAAFLLAAATAAWSQTTPPAAAPLQFEVASIKASGPLDPAAIMSGKAHVGMSIDKARVDIGSATLMQLICQAYKIKPYQVAGNPEWLNIGLNADRFDILAKLPDGTNKDQVPEMLQSLLAERFKLKLHHDTRETPVYALTIGKGGPKLKEVPDDPPPAPPAPPAEGPGAGPSDPAPSPAAVKGEVVMGNGDNQVRMKQTGNGMSVSSKETGPMKVSMENGMIHMSFEKASMESLVAILSQYLDKPVVDQTGLKGKYEATLDVAMADAMRMAQKLGMNVPAGAMGGPGANANRAPAEAASDPSGGSLFTSVQQLGLKLEARKLPYDFIVIDHIEKAPTEN